MSNIAHLRPQSGRACASCFVPLPRLAPTWHKHCKKCWLHFRNYHIVRAMQREAGR